MYLCVMDIVTKSILSQESERSCICVLEGSLPSQESERSWICVLEISLPSLYQARKVNGHVFVCYRYRFQACTKPGKWSVMYLCVIGIVT